MNKKWIFLAVVILIVLGVALESKAAPAEQPKKGGTLVVGLGKEPGNPNPFIATISTTQFVREASYESLLSQDDEGRILPNLAEKYEVSSGGTVFTLRLRKGVKFHNGKEMTADDVLWSANHVKNEKNGAFGQNLIKDVKSVEKVDDYTVKITLGTPAVTFLSRLADIGMLPIVPANSLKTGQIKLDKNAFVPGTGPFIIEQFQPGFDEVLKRFPDYWGGPAYVDKIIFRPITDGANRFNALRTGDVQLADRLSVLNATRVKKGEVKGISILEEPLGGFQHLIVNYLNPLFQKLEMRQALLYATDKQRLVDEAFFGAGIPADIMMNPKDMWGKAAALPPHKRDLAKAQAALKAAGYAGQPLVLIGRKSASQLLESYQRMLGEAGINVKVELLEAGIMKDRVMGGKYDLYVDGASLTGDPVTTMLPYYYTDKVEKGRYSNPKIDQLFDSLDKEFDQKKRLKLFRDLAWALHNDVADIPLLYEVRFLGMSDKIRGYGPPPGGSYTESGEYFKQVWLK